MRTFQPGDEHAVYETHQETFKDLWEHVRRPYDEWAHWFLSADAHYPDLWFLAFDRERLVGVGLCAPDQNQPRVGWVHILGVLRSWRGRGLGHALLLHAFHEFRRRGFERVVLGVDAESPTGAHRLYEGAGMRVLHRWDTYEKVLA
jgi:mycothiol synthase